MGTSNYGHKIHIDGWTRHLNYKQMNTDICFISYITIEGTAYIKWIYLFKLLYNLLLNLNI